MTASLENRNDKTRAATVPRRRAAHGRTAARAMGRGLLYCAALLPVAIGAVIVTLFGQARLAAPWWRRLRTRVLGAPSPEATGRPGSFAVFVHALLSLLLGIAALAPLGMELLFLLRGVLYGVVDPGPYDTSWGGPTRAGAWSAHFLVGLPFAAAALAALVGIAATHQRLTLALDGVRRAPWVIPVTLVTAFGGTLFFVAWIQQI